MQRNVVWNKHLFVNQWAFIFEYLLYIATALSVSRGASENNIMDSENNHSVMLYTECLTSVHDVTYVNIGW